MTNIFFQAPFGAFRSFVTGTLRSTAPFMTYSAARGLIFNIAGIETRVVANSMAETTLTRNDLPKISIALGALEYPEIQSLFQQLHKYPVAQESTAEKKKTHERTKGSKNGIEPARREFLSKLKGYICIDGNAEIEQKVKNALKGIYSSRYGLPFLGDNSFALDYLKEAQTMEPANWFCRVDESDDCSEISTPISQFTLCIDRDDSSKTTSVLCTPTAEKLPVPPAKAWVTL